MSSRTTTEDAPPEMRLDLAGLGAAPFAQVNLLPPEVHSRRALGRVKLRLALALVLVVLLTIAGVGYAAFTDKVAADGLAQKDQEVQSLVDQEAKYAEVPQVKGEIARVQAGRALGMSTEVMWPTYVAAIQAVTPTGVTIQSMTGAGTAPGVSAAAPADPLSAEGVGAVTFNARSTTLPNVGAWLDALASIPGFSNPTFSSATRTDGNGVPYYDFTVSLVLDQSVFAHRFAENGNQS